MKAKVVRNLCVGYEIIKYRMYILYKMPTHQPI